jgi:small redox-active disulfide protein 2
MKIQVLGSGCRKCEHLAQNVEAAIEEGEVEVTFEKVTDVNTILEMGVMITPALVINGEIVSKGKVPSVEELIELIEDQ